MGSLAGNSRFGEEYFGSDVKQSSQLLADRKGVHGGEIQKSDKEVRDISSID
jgi:hypothetical protein